MRKISILSVAIFSLVLNVFNSSILSAQTTGALTDTAGQRHADQLSSLSSKAIYDLDNELIGKIIEGYINPDPSIYGVKVIETLENEILFSIYKDENGRISRNQNFPDFVKSKPAFLSISKYRNENIGLIEVYYEKSNFIGLTDEELNWIKEHPSISVGVEEWYPFIRTKANGRIGGIAGDFLRLVQEKTGLEVRVISKIWADLLSDFQKGQIDLLPATYFTEERATYGRYSNPFFSAKEFLYVREEDSTINGFEDLKGKKIAIVKDFGTIPKVNAKYPEIEIVETASQLESMYAVLNGKVDATFESQIVLEDIMRRELITGLRPIAQDSFETSKLYFFSRFDEPLLNSILTKALDSITLAERTQILSKWIADSSTRTTMVLPEYVEVKQDIEIIKYITIFFFSLVLLLLALWIYKGRPTQLSIRDRLFLVSFVYVGLVIMIGAMIAVLLDKDYEQIKIEERKYASLNLALELKQSSDELTRFARTYAVTGNPVYEEYFNKILQMRNGEIPHPQNYTRSYWDHVAAEKVPFIMDGETYAISKRMEELGLTDQEKQLLQEAKNNSDDLVNLENIAMNAVKGVYQDKTGAFTIQAQPDLNLAAQLLHGEDYHLAKSKIMKPIDDFFLLLELRTNNEMHNVRVQFQAIMITVSILTIITIIYSIYVFFLLRKHVIQPLSIFENSATLIANGKYDEHVPVQSKDEFGALAKVFNNMSDAIAQDMQNRLEAAALIQDREKRLQSIIDNAVDGIIIISKVGVIESFSPAAERIFGFQPIEVIGQNVKMLMPSNIANEHDMYLSDYLGGKSRNVVGNNREVTGQRKDGTTFPMDLAVGVSEINGEKFFTGIVRDISVRKEVEDAIEKSEERTRLILSSVGEGVFGVDMEGVITFANPQTEVLLGYKNYELIGKKAHPLLHYKRLDGSDYPVHECWMFKSFTFGNEYRIDDEVLWRKDGSPLEIEYHATPMRKDDEIIGSVISFQDISARKDAERKLRDAYEVISSSITYASQIQQSALPDHKFMAPLVQEYFLWWEPRDVVGGDLYWVGPWGDGCLVLLGDCTGHGVPGAFMTLISIAAIERSVSEIVAPEVSKLVTRIHQHVQKMLSQHYEGGETDDGIELGAIYFEPFDEKLTFSGARFDLMITDEEGFEIVKGTKSGMGYRKVPYIQEFKEEIVEITPTRQFYLSSDGTYDQVGGERRRMFGRKNLMRFLQDKRNLTMEKQKQALMEELKAYQGNEKRRDDISVMGIKFLESE